MKRSFEIWSCCRTFFPGGKFHYDSHLSRSTGETGACDCYLKRKGHLVGLSPSPVESSSNPEKINMIELNWRTPNCSPQKGLLGVWGKHLYV